MQIREKLAQIPTDLKYGLIFCVACMALAVVVHLTL